MNLYCIKCLKFTNNRNIKKRGNRWKINFSYCINCGFKKFEIIYEEELGDLLKSLCYIQKQCYFIVWSLEERQKVKTLRLGTQVKKK